MRSLVSLPGGYFGKISFSQHDNTQEGFTTWVKGLPAGYASVVLAGKSGAGREESELTSIEQHFGSLSQSHILQGLRYRQRQDRMTISLIIGTVIFGIAFLFFAAR